MVVRILFALVLVACAVQPSAAQQYQRIPTCGTASPGPGLNPGYMDSTGNTCTTSSAGTVNVAPFTGTPTQAAVSCAATTTTLLAAAAASKFITVQVPTAATAHVWVNVAGAAATAAAPNIDLAPGASVSFINFVPTAQLNCISATGTTAVSVVYN